MYQIPSNLHWFERKHSQQHFGTSSETLGNAVERYLIPPHQYESKMMNENGLESI